MDSETVDIYRDINLEFVCNLTIASLGYDFESKHNGFVISLLSNGSLPSALGLKHNNPQC